MWSADEINAVIKDAHEGSGESMQSNSLQSHIGITSLIRELSVRFYWRTVEADITNYVKACPQCQRVNPKFDRATPQLHPVSAPSEVMKQIGVDISCLPEANGFRYNGGSHRLLFQVIGSQVSSGQVCCECCKISL